MGIGSRWWSRRWPFAGRGMCERGGVWVEGLLGLGFAGGGGGDVISVRGVWEHFSAAGMRAVVSPRVFPIPCSLRHVHLSWPRLFQYSSLYLTLHRDICLLQRRQRRTMWLSFPAAQTQY